MTCTAEVIETASLNGGASSGEIQLAKFLMFCLGYDVEFKLKDVLYYIDSKVVYLVIQLVESGELENLIKSMNPKLYKEMNQELENNE